MLLCLPSLPGSLLTHRKSQCIGDGPLYWHWTRNFQFRRVHSRTCHSSPSNRNDCRYIDATSSGSWCFLKVGLLPIDRPEATFVEKRLRDGREAWSEEPLGESGQPKAFPSLTIQDDHMQPCSTRAHVLALLASLIRPRWLCKQTVSLAGLTAKDLHCLSTAWLP